MPAEYHSQPISGFSGHLPGAKWQVGGRYVPPSNKEHTLNSINGKSELIPHQQDHSHYNNDNMISSMGVDEISRSLSNMKEEMNKLQKALDERQRYEKLEDIKRDGYHGEPTDSTKPQASSVKIRSKSVPKRVEKNPFDGIESGWWSKGEVQRNKERRLLANGEQITNDNNWNRKHVSEKHYDKPERSAEYDIPAAGYSGHIQGLRQVGIGKPFNVAAKQAIKEFVERRSSSHNFGGRQEDEEALVNSVPVQFGNY